MIATMGYASTATPREMDWGDTSVINTYYIELRPCYGECPVIITTPKALLAIEAAKKDRLHWTFQVVMFWLWVYVISFVLIVRRLMVSMSGWLARVGKKRKSGK